MIFRVGFDHRDDALAFRVWCAEAGLPEPVDTCDRADCPYPPERILEVRMDAGEDDFLTIWWQFVLSFGKG